MTAKNEGGLIGEAQIDKVLEDEIKAEGYTALVSDLHKAEPILWRHLRYWLRREAQRFKERNPNLTDQDLKYFTHLLERYLVRGWRLQRKAWEVEIDGMMQ
jgi:hypothetical protein